MTEDRSDSFIDRVKDMFGMGTHADDEIRTAPDLERTDLDDDMADNANRPAGPDYGAGETVDREFGVGLDRESMAGTGESNTGTGLGYDFDRGTTTDPEEIPVDESEWTREGAASGESPFDTEEDTTDRR